MAGNKLVADTSAVIALLNGDRNLIRVFQNAEKIFLPFAVRGELLYGAMCSSRPRKNIGRLEDLFEACETIYADESVSRLYAEIRFDLRKKGRPIPENDIWVAACAMSRNMPLICRDAHFGYVDGLVME